LIPLLTHLGFRRTVPLNLFWLYSDCWHVIIYSDVKTYYACHWPALHGEHDVGLHDVGLLNVGVHSGSVQNVGMAAARGTRQYFSSAVKIDMNMPTYSKNVHFLLFLVVRCKTTLATYPDNEFYRLLYNLKSVISRETLPLSRCNVMGLCSIF
jgi:hypothetical protein